MRGFIVMCLCTVALAAPQGYNYNQGGVAVQQPAIGGFHANFMNTAPTAAGGSFLQVGQSAQHASFAGHQNIHQQQQQQHHQQQQLQHQQQQAVISKRFFIHSAPEDMEEDYKEKHITIGVPRKNYNVVFIKSPSKSNKKTSIKISPAPHEEKTVIYVLSKKADAADIHAEVVEHATTTAKPEVFFIKYKTNEEANHAQEQIRAQYDALGGSSQFTDEGIAPVSSVIGSLGDAGDGTTASGSNASAGGIHAAAAPNFVSSPAASSNLGAIHNSSASGNGYLPPNFY